MCLTAVYCWPEVSWRKAAVQEYDQKSYLLIKWVDNCGVGEAGLFLGIFDVQIRRIGWMCAVFVVQLHWLALFPLCYMGSW